MSRDNLIAAYVRAANERIAHGDATDPATDGAVRAAVSDEQDRLLLEQLGQDFARAREPEEFWQAPITRPDARFEQVFELLRRTFDDSVREPREHYIRGLQRERREGAPPNLLLGRFWQVSGRQEYDAAGKLVSFAFDPFTATESIAGLINGNYMALDPLRPGEGMGAIGHLATRPALRRGRGHGSTLVEVFEREIAAIAEQRGERARLILLEAETDSWGFWAKRGYRWPDRSRYHQPPLAFDPATGERYHDEVPELLMVKLIGGEDNTAIEPGLLMDAVETMYRGWCLSGMEDFPPAARQRATDYVMGKVFADFVSSLPPRGASVPLVAPPGSNPPEQTPIVRR